MCLTSTPVTFGLFRFILPRQHIYMYIKALVHHMLICEHLCVYGTSSSDINMCMQPT